MNVPEDIESRVSRDFGANSADALELVTSYLVKMTHEPIRTTRCAIYLASGSIEELDHMLDQGRRDWRNVIWWAEYDRCKGPPVRDFNVPFDETT